MRLADQRILVMGAGRSGASVAKYAHSQGARVRLTDLRPDAPEVAGCSHVYGRHDRLDFLEADQIIVSPGVPAAQKDLKAAAAAGVPLVGELGFAAGRLQAASIPLLAITGTNGKSSVTDYTAQLLRRAGLRVFAGGNLGHPLSEALMQTEEIDIAVVEVSSYQLELPGELAPSAAVVLNLSPDHLGRHKTMENYARTKARLFAKMNTGALALIPAMDRSGLLSHGQTEAKRCWSGRTPGVRIIDDQIHLQGTADDGTVDLSGLKLLGTHNRENAAAAVFLAVAGGIRRHQIDLSTLEPLPHRLQPVHSSGEIRWVNDSKATNVDAALTGIAGIGGSMVVLLGGQGKPGADYSRLRAKLDQGAHAIVCFGTAGPEIGRALRGLNIHHASTLAEAVKKAAGLAKAQDVVLLSPACASFDEFDDFEDRGAAFSTLAQEIQA